MNRAILSAASFFIAIFNSEGQQSATPMKPEEYIAKFHEAAIANMIEHKVPASITLAQGLFESGFGNSPLAVNANNHFGIKCHDWKGETYYHDDDAPRECFRKYASALESYADHALFLKNRKRYAKCFELEITDYKGWARELKAAGYATLPTYAEKIVSVIERYGLDRYDRIALARMNGSSPEENFAGNANPGSAVVHEKPAETQTAVSMPEGIAISSGASIHKKPFTTREILEINGVPCIIARKGDSKASLSAEFDLAEWQIRRYNDLGMDEEITPGMRIYLAPKKDFSEHMDFHVVSQGENLKHISNMHGVRKEAIMELNRLAEENVQPGQTLKLR